MTARAQQTFEFSELIVRASVAIIAGLILAYIQFRASDNHYVKLISSGEYNEEF